MLADSESRRLMSAAGSTVEELEPVETAGAQSQQELETFVPNATSVSFSEKTIKKGNGKFLHFPVAGIAALSLFTLAGLIAFKSAKRATRVKPLAEYDFYRYIQAIREPGSFLEHSSFTEDTVPAKQARRGIDELLKKAREWAQAAKNPGVPRVEPEQYEVALLEGAVICRHILRLEDDAAVAPYNPLEHGFSRKIYEVSDTPEDAAAAAAEEGREKVSTEKLANVNESKDKLRKAYKEVVGWISEMRKILDAEAVKEAVENKYKRDDTNKNKKRAKLVELDNARSFYKLLEAYVKHLILPPNDAPLVAWDSYFLKKSALRDDVIDEINDLGRHNRNNESYADSSDTDSPVLAVHRARNKYVPEWLANILLHDRGTTPRNLLELRVAVNAEGLPRFATATTTCVADFKAMLGDTLEYVDRREEIKLLSEGQTDKSENKIREKIKKQKMLEMNVDVALAAFDIGSIVESLSTHKNKPSPSKVEAIVTSLADRYTGLQVTARRWAALAAGKYLNDTNMTKSERDGLVRSLGDLASMCYYPPQIAAMYLGTNGSRPGKGEEIQELQNNLLVYRGDITLAAYGPLGRSGIIPRWWAHIG